MGKSCAFLGNDYVYELPMIPLKIKEEVIRLIENNNVDTFYVGEKGSYEIEAYKTVLDVQKMPEYAHIQIILVIACVQELHSFEKADLTYQTKRRKFDEFVFPPKAERGYKRWCYVHRNNWIIENTDYIIAYNLTQGRAYNFCQKARRKGVEVIELTELYKFVDAPL